MSAILLGSISICLAGFALSLLLLQRLKDWRIGILSAMIFLMALSQIFTLPKKPIDFPISLTASADELPGLLVSILALLALVFLERMIRECDSLNANLKFAEERYRDFAETASDYFWETDQDLRFSYFSERFREVSGVAPQTLIGETHAESRIPNMDEPAWQQHLSDLAAHRPFNNFILPRIKPDGEVVWLSISGKPVIDQDGKFKGYRGTGGDITARRRAEEEVRQREILLAAFIDNSPAEIFLVDLQGRYVLVNRAWQEVQGLTNEEAKGLTAHDVFPAERAELFAEQFRWVQETGKVFDQEIVSSTPGVTKALHIVKFPMVDANGRTIGMGGVATNTTDRIEAEEQLRQAQEMQTMELEQRVADRTRELRDAQEQLVRKSRLETLGQLTATVSHELRNPLGALRTSIAAIRKLTPDEDSFLSRAAKVADNSVTRCDNIVADLLEYSRLRPLEARAMDFDPWLAELLKEYEFDPTIKVERHLGAMTNLEMDSNRMRQVVVNLLDNACQAMIGEDDGTEPARDPSLEVSALRDHDQVVLRITDNGPGVSLENQGKIFEPLFSTKSFGVGLGLPIIKRIIEQHGGAIEVVSEPAESTSFIVRLPLKIPFGSIT